MSDPIIAALISAGASFAGAAVTVAVTMVKVGGVHRQLDGVALALKNENATAATDRAAEGAARETALLTKIPDPPKS